MNNVRRRGALQTLGHPVADLSEWSVNQHIFPSFPIFPDHLVSDLSEFPNLSEWFRSIIRSLPILRGRSLPYDCCPFHDSCFPQGNAHFAMLMYTYLHIYIYIYIYTYIYTYIYIYVYLYTYVYLGMHVYTSSMLRLHICICTYIYMYFVWPNPKAIRQLVLRSPKNSLSAGED